MTRFSSKFRVIVIEEPIFEASSSFLEITSTKENIWIIVPHIHSEVAIGQRMAAQQVLLRAWFNEFGVKDYMAWFYTPMAIPLLEGLPDPSLIVYDCMDELSAFKGAPNNIKEQEQSLLAIADIVFTGGLALYEAKRKLHPNIHAFPSSIDKQHFLTARTISSEPDDQSDLAHPRIGFFGVIDERFDIDLIRQLALHRPAWQFVFVGPVVKIDPATLPKANNIRYMGARTYDELPAYLSGWDVALIPFAMNESTQFISPTKTPEYLAGGVPVVSTPIADVINPYGDLGLVYIANNSEEFITGIEWGLQKGTDSKWLGEVDQFLDGISWDNTWSKMSEHITNKLDAKQNENSPQKRREHV